MRKNHSKIVCIKLVHLPYLQTRILDVTFRHVVTNSDLHSPHEALGCHDINNKHFRPPG